jgi:plastocyanin
LVNRPVAAPFSLPENFVRDFPLLRQSKSVRIKWAPVEPLTLAQRRAFSSGCFFLPAAGFGPADCIAQDFHDYSGTRSPGGRDPEDRNSGKDTAMGRTSIIRGTLLRGLALVILITVLTGCKRQPGPSPEGTGTPTSDVLSGKVTILLQDNEFHPQKLTIRAGTMVSWINKDPQFRTVRSDDGLFQSSSLAIGQMFSFTFDTPGTYLYYCEPGGGPGGEGMSGVITVVA